MRDADDRDLLVLHSDPCVRVLHVLHKGLDLQDRTARVSRAAPREPKMPRGTWALRARSPLPSQATGPAMRLTVQGREETPQEAGGGELLLDSGGDRGASGCRRHCFWTHARP